MKIGSIVELCTVLIPYLDYRQSAAKFVQDFVLFVTSGSLLDVKDVFVGYAHQTTKINDVSVERILRTWDGPPESIQLS